MKKTAVTLVCLAGLSGLPGLLGFSGSTLAADGALTPAQTLNRRSIGEIELSPDGSRAAFTVTDPVKGTTRSRAIWLLDLASGTARRLTFSGRSDFSPRWSPDGQSLAFLSNRDSNREGAAQLYLLPMHGGEAARLVDRKEGVTAFRWSPDGRRIALLMSEARSEDEERRQRDKDDARIVDKDDRHPRLWLVDVASKELRQATHGPWEIRQIEWLSTQRLAAVATAAPADDRWTDRIYSIDLDAGADARFDELAAPKGPFGGLSVSPDGKTIAYVGSRVDGPEPHDLFVVPAQRGGSARNLTATTIDRPIGQPRWVNTTTLIIHVSRGFKSELASVSADGRAQPLAGLDVNPSAFARTADGTLIYAGETTQQAAELYVQRPNGRAQPATSLNREWTSIATVAPEFVKYKGADGTEIEAALLLPSRSAGAAGNDRAPHPFVVLVHGGPTGRWADAFEPWGQLLAARGYAVLYPNVRGSTGYGQRFVEMNRADWGGGDFRDVMAGVDAMIARGVADPKRLGIGGWSYGGYMAAWAVTQTTRFKASVSGAPVIDLASEFGTENGPAYDEWFYGTPYEKLEGFIKSSPITFVKNAKTPTLLLQGEDDTTDPIGQSQQFYRGLKRYGVDTDLVLYPREPHGLREEMHLIDRMNRILAWYDRYLKPSTAGTAQP